MYVCTAESIGNSIQQHRLFFYSVANIIFIAYIVDRSIYVRIQRYVITS